MPIGVHVPQFTYSVPTADTPRVTQERSQSQAFAFSAFFQQSSDSSLVIPTFRSNSHIMQPAGCAVTNTAFSGFSWGPSRDAFSPSGKSTTSLLDHITPPRALQSVCISSARQQNPQPTYFNAFATPTRPDSLSIRHTHPRPSAICRSAARRAVSDREAMKQLVDCIGMSAQKKVLASGRKLKVLDSFNRSIPNAINKDLRFGLPPVVITKSSDLLPMDLSLDLDGLDSGTEGPQSPSPRPGSAMSTLSRRSATPTTTVSYSARLLDVPQSTTPKETSQCSQMKWGDEAISRLEDKHSYVISQLCDIQLQLDGLRATTER